VEQAVEIIDPQRCPLCGKENQCGMVAGKGTCWCFTDSIPEHVMERVPERARDLACVCERCAHAERINMR
jgi:hypothetical protein